MIQIFSTSARILISRDKGVSIFDVVASLVKAFAQVLVEDLLEAIDDVIELFALDANPGAIGLELAHSRTYLT